MNKISTEIGSELIDILYRRQKMQFVLGSDLFDGITGKLNHLFTGEFSYRLEDELLFEL